MKYSKVAGAVRWSGGTIVLDRGMSAEDDHPLVLERPDLFTDEPPGARLTSPVPPVIERATRAPGEVRTGPVATRPRKASAKDSAKAKSTDE